MKVNYRQISVMIFMSFIALKFLALPSLLFTKSEYMSWLVVLTLMIIDGIYAFMIMGLMKKNQDKNIYEFLKNTFGVVLAKIILILIAGHLLIIISNLTKGLEFFVVENLYNQFKWYMFILPLIAVVGFMMYKGVRNIARCFEMFFYAIILGCIYIAIKSIVGIDILVYSPLFRNGFQPLLTSAYTHVAWFGSATFLVMLFGCVDFKNEKKWQFTRYIIFAILLVMFLYFVFYGLFGITSPIHNFALIDLSQYYTGSSSINELSWLVVSLWVVAQSIQLAMYGYCLMRALMFIFNIKSPMLAIFLINLYLLIWTYIGHNTVNNEKILFSDGLIIFSIVVQYVLPIILILGDLIKRKVQKHKDKKVVKHEKFKVSV